MKSHRVEPMVADENPEEAPNQQALDELRQLDKAFHADLFQVFNEGGAQFGDHLRGLLFDLWNRARQRPVDTDTRLAELEELAKAKTELRQLVNREFAQQLPAVAEQFKSSIEQITSSTFGFNMANALAASDINLDMALTKKLYALLNFDNTELFANDCNTYLQFDKISTSGSSPSEPSLNIPELQDGDVDDELQVALKKRLHREGLVPPDHMGIWDWKPVFINVETGRQGALDYNLSQVINTELVTANLASQFGQEWLFPHPRPVYNFSDASCLHVKLIIDGVDGENTLYTWQHEYDSNTNGETIKSVTMIGIMPTAVVRAEYRTVSKTPFND